MKVISTLFRVIMAIGFGLAVAVTLGVVVSMGFGAQYSGYGIAAGFVFGAIGGWLRK